MKQMFNRWMFIGIAIGAVLAALLIYGVRMSLAKNTRPHYHANFAVFVDGKKLPFVGPTFYEEVSSCGNAGPNDPKARAHMHNNVDSVVHVHDYAVTWSAFFANIRYGLSDKSLQLDDQTLIDGQDGKHLIFWVNGKPVAHLANAVIQDDSTVMISYGTDDTKALKKQYDAIPRKADGFDHGADPSACTGSQALTFKDRVVRAFSVNQDILHHQH